VNIKPEALKKAIDEAPHFVSNEAKRWLKKLFEDGFGVEFKKEIEMEVGCVYRHRDYSNVAYLLCDINQRTIGKTKSIVEMVNLGKDPCVTGWLQEEGNDEDFFLIANSLEEYYRKKFNGELND